MRPEPRWRQIAEDLRQKIEDRELGRDNEPLPPEMELREQYNASRNTIRDAVKWLTTRGLVETKPGHGTFVTQRIDPFVTPLSTDISAGLGGELTAYESETKAYTRSVEAVGREPKSSVPRVEIQQAKGLVASELRLDDGVTVVCRHQLRWIGGIPWSMQTSFYPMKFFEKGATRIIEAVDIGLGVVPYLEEVTGIKQAGWRERFTVRGPDRNETEFFSLPDDGRIAVIETIRTGYDADGVPFRMTLTTYPADRNQFIMTVGKVPADTQSRTAT
jgi:GntR family transcriptional regulator